MRRDGRRATHLVRARTGRASPAPLPGLHSDRDWYERRGRSGTVGRLGSCVVDRLRRLPMTGFAHLTCVAIRVGLQANRRAHVGAFGRRGAALPPLSRFGHGRALRVVPAGNLTRTRTRGTGTPFPLAERLGPPSVLGEDDKRPTASNTVSGQTRREAGTQSQGSREPRPPGCRHRSATRLARCHVKAKLTRFTTAIALLAMTAMSLGAGMRWWD